MDEFYDNILNDDNIDPDGYSFIFKSTFKIIDNDGFYIFFHKLFKRSFKNYEKEIDIILKSNPINILNIHNIELNEFKINKLYKGLFVVNYYNIYKYDIFFKDFF